MKRPIIKAIFAVMLAAFCAAPTVNVFVAADADDAYQLADGSGLSVLADNNIFCRNTLTERAGFRLAGTAIDAEDGDISGDIAWSSDIDGSLDTGAEVYVTLTAGTHTITASVTDSGSSEDTDTVSVVVSERRAVIRNRTRIPRRKVSRGFRWF